MLSSKVVAVAASVGSALVLLLLTAGATLLLWFIQRRRQQMVRTAIVGRIFDRIEIVLDSLSREWNELDSVYARRSRRRFMPNIMRKNAGNASGVPPAPGTPNSQPGSPDVDAASRMSRQGSASSAAVLSRGISSTTAATYSRGLSTSAMPGLGIGRIWSEWSERSGITETFGSLVTMTRHGIGSTDTTCFDSTISLDSNMWKWCVDKDGTARTTHESSSGTIRVLICVNGLPGLPEREYVRQSRTCESLASGLSSASSTMGASSTMTSSGGNQDNSPAWTNCVASIIQHLARREMFEATAARCCVVSDTSGNGRVPAGIARIDGVVLDTGFIVADMLPMLCDVADYCVLVFPDGPVLGALRRMDPVLPSEAATSSVSSKAGKFCFQDVIFGSMSTRRGLGPTCYLAGLAMLSLKTERQSFALAGFECSVDASLQNVAPYSTGLKGNSRFAELDMVVRGMNFHKALMNLWALVVSHGSYSFAWDAASQMAEMSSLSSTWPLCGQGRERGGRRGDSISDEVLFAFSTRRKRSPLMARGTFGLSRLKMSASFSNMALSLKGLAKRSKSSAPFARPARTRLLNDLQDNLKHRGIMSRYVRLMRRSPEYDSLVVAVEQGEDQVRFAVPCSHPMAQELRLAAEDIDWLLVNRARGTLAHMQKLMSLETLVERMQGFLLSYLRKVNSACASEAGSRVQAAAFELYTAGAEEQTYLVNLVSEFLCIKAELRGYQSVMKVLEAAQRREAEKPLEPQLDFRRLGSDLSDGSRPSYEAEAATTVYINIISAKHVPLEASEMVYGSEEVQEPVLYCSCGVEGYSTDAVQTDNTTLTKDPVWKEQMVLHDYLPNSALVFDIWQSDAFTQDCLVARARLPASYFQKSDFVGDLPIECIGNSLHRESPQVAQGGMPALPASPRRHTRSLQGTLKVRVSMTGHKAVRKSTFMRIASRSPTGLSLSRSNSRINIRSSTCSQSSVGLRSTVSGTSNFTWDMGGPQWALANVLVSMTELHRTLVQVLGNLVQEANKTAETTGIWGSAAIEQPAGMTSFWDLVEAGTLLSLENHIWSGDRGTLAKADRAAMTPQVDQQLESIGNDGFRNFLADDFPKVRDRGLVQVQVTCDNFYMMHMVMAMLEKSHHLCIHSRESTLRSKRKQPLVKYVVSLMTNDFARHRSSARISSPSKAGVEFDDMYPGGPLDESSHWGGRGVSRESRSSNMMSNSFHTDSFAGDEGRLEVVLVHKKIAGVSQANTGQAKKVVAQMHNVSAICRTLCLGDPDRHPSMWCISLRQLQDFAREVEAEMGTVAYRNASCAEIVENAIAPRTSKARTSFANMLNWQEFRQIDVFVSHCWKENFGAFVDSVSVALEQRVEAGEINLWICCFALFQDTDYHVVKKQVGTILAEAPFEKALTFAREFLVVRNSECDMYSRAWCVFEIFRARQLGLKISVTGPDTFTKTDVDIMSCQATDQDDEQMIKSAIVNANLADELNKVVSEIKDMGTSSGPAREDTGAPLVRQRI